MKLGRTGVLLLLALCIAAGGLIAGCGSSGDDISTGGSATTSTGESTDGAESAPADAEAEAAEQGKKAAEMAGKPVALPAETIGILQQVGAAESAAGLQESTEEAAGTIGWKTIVCDGQGDPTKIAACGSSLVAQKVDAIVSLANDPSTWAVGLSQARDAGIPVINIGGAVSPAPGLDGSYAPDTGKQGEALAAWLLDELETISGGKDIAVEGFPAPFAQTRTDALKAAVKGTDVTISATGSVNPTDVQNGTKQTVTDQLTSNPDLKAIWFSYDVAAQSGALAVASKFPGKSFPDRPLVVTFGTDPSTLALLRSGQIDALAENAITVNAWEAIDQLAGFFARKAKIYPGPITDSYAPYAGFKVDGYRVFTKEDVPTDGPVPAPESPPSFFGAKWAQEYGI